MGHANSTNISKTLNRMLHQGPTTVRQVVDELDRTKQAVHAGEGLLTERCMLGMTVEVLVGVLLDEGHVEPAGQLTRKQAKALRQWRNHESDEWDSGEDGEGGEYGIFDSIPWRALKKRLPVIKYIEN